MNQVRPNDQIDLEGRVESLRLGKKEEALLQCESVRMDYWALLLLVVFGSLRVPSEWEEEKRDFSTTSLFRNLRFLNLLSIISKRKGVRYEDGIADVRW